MNLALLTLGGLAFAGIYFGFKQKDPNLKLSSCFFDKLAVPLYTLFSEWHSNSIFLIDYIKDDHIIANTQFPEIYGIELRGNDTIVNFMNNSLISQIIRDYKTSEDSYFFYCIQKQGKYQKQYIFSHNKSIIKNIASYFNAKLLSGNKLLNVIYNQYLQNTYFIDDKQIKQALEINKNDNLESEPEFMNFKRLVKQSILQNLKNVDCFQAYKSIDVKQTNLQQLFKLDFEGSIWFYFDISQRRIQNHIQKLINYTKIMGDKRPFVALKEKYEHNETELAIVNSVMFLKRYTNDQIGMIGSFLKTSYLRKELFRTQLLQKMPLKYRDGEFDFLVQQSYLENFIATCHKKNAKKPDIFGIDKNGAFINYSFSEENDNPHSVIIAKPGSGKSVSKQKIIAQMIDFDSKTMQCKNLGKDIGQVRIRSYDIGFSDEKFVKLIKANPNNNVAHIKNTFSSFGYNLVALNEDYGEEEFEADLKFCVALTNIILDTQNSVALTLDEETLYEEAIRHIYTTKKFDIKYVLNLQKNNSEIYNELIALGYTDYQPLTDIKEEKFNFLKKPLLNDIVKYVTVQAENMQLKETERKANSQLAHKLDSIEKLNIFSNFDKFDIKEADFLSMDLNNFKESSLFVPIFFAIFQKTYLKDREYAIWCRRNNRPAPKLCYAIEEAKNYFRDNNFFESMFEKVTLEARKYNVHLCFVVQNAEHIPSQILKNINTRIFLLRADQKKECIEEADLAFKIPQKVKIALDNTEQFELCVWYSGGVFNMKFDISDKELEIFNTNPNEITGKNNENE